MNLILSIVFFTCFANAQFAGLPDNYDYDPDLYRDEVLVTMDRENILDSIGHDSGYMYKGMDQRVLLANVSNPNLAQLYNRNLIRRGQSNVALPITFQNLINYSYGYIKSTSDANSEIENGVPNTHLAFVLIKASFCFGTDPLMTLSKIRRETSFKRMAISSGSAVGFSQMTGAGISEVHHQMSGNEDLAIPGMSQYFKSAIRCLTGKNNYHNFSGESSAIKTKLRNDYILDIIYGQILLKTYVSYTAANKNRGISEEESKSSYRDAFVLYNGDNQEVKGQCMGGARVPMKIEYSCDIIQFFNELSVRWNNYLQRIKNKRIS